MKAPIVVALLVGLAGCSTVPVVEPQPGHPMSYLARSFGSSMDDFDRDRANDALESGSEERPFSWVNPASNRRFTVTPLSTFKRGSKDCRSYSAIYGGRKVSGTACRNEDGSWSAR